MPVASGYVSVQREIDLIIKEDLSPDARRLAFANYARQELRETQSRNARALGREPTYTQYADGVKGAPLERAERVITFEFDLFQDVLEWFDDQLILNSPVGPPEGGHYGQSHVLLVDGLLVTSGNYPDTFSEAIFGNTQPYARKIEPGADRKALSPQAPEGVYEVVAAIGKSRFGNIASVRYGFRDIPGTDGRQPAIIIRPR